MTTAIVPHQHHVLMCSINCRHRRCVDIVCGLQPQRLSTLVLCLAKRRSCYFQSTLAKLTTALDSHCAAAVWFVERFYDEHPVRRDISLGISERRPSDPQTIPREGRQLCWHCSGRIDCSECYAAMFGDCLKGRIHFLKSYSQANADHIIMRGRPLKGSRL